MTASWRRLGRPLTRNELKDARIAASCRETAGPWKWNLVAVGFEEFELGAAVLVEECMGDHVEAVG